MSESDFIALLRQLPLHPAARNLDDDAAVLQIGSETLVLTHDTMVEGTHFLSEQDAADVAWKLVATNLSDLAAKGARPVGAMLSYTLSGHDDRDERFAEGLGEAIRAFDLPLLGGDTVSSAGPRTLGLTAIGRAAHTPVPDRRGAEPGDNIFVTGILGRAMLGFEDLAGGGPNALAYSRPTPLIDEGVALAPLVTAMMDVSDGLLLDTWRLAKVSNVTINLDSEAIPVASRARLNECIRWGDDYQLLFTLPANTKCPVKATKIGAVSQKETAILRVDEQALSPEDGLGYQHG